MTSASPTVGIDVSHHNDTIDWAKVHAAGYRFAFIKATEGATVTDALFSTNRQEARDAGLRTGAYHFYHPQTDVAKQVENFLAVVGSMQSGELPPVLDLEVPAEWLLPGMESWAKLPQSERVPRVLQWLQAVESRLGVRPIIYLSPSFANDTLRNDPRLGIYDLWIAHYTTASAPSVPKPWTTYKYWQHSETGTVDGIPGKAVDLNRYNGIMPLDTEGSVPADSAQPDAASNENSTTAAKAGCGCESFLTRLWHHFRRMLTAIFG